MRLTYVVALVAGVGCAHVRQEAGGRGSAHQALSDPAGAYLQADVGMFLASGDAAALAAFDRRHEAAEVIRGEAPTGEAVLGALASANAWVRHEGVISVLARGAAGEPELQAIVTQYAGSGSFFHRYHAMQAISMVEPRVTARNAGALTPVLLGEANDAIRNVGLQIAMNLPSSERMRVLVEYVRTGSPTLARNAYAAAWSLGPETGCELRARIAELGKGGGLEVLKEVEASGGTAAFKRPNAGCS